MGTKRKLRGKEYITLAENGRCGRNRLCFILSGTATNNYSFCTTFPCFLIKHQNVDRKMQTRVYQCACINQMSIPIQHSHSTNKQINLIAKETKGYIVTNKRHFPMVFNFFMLALQNCLQIIGKQPVFSHFFQSSIKKPFFFLQSVILLKRTFKIAYLIES